MKKLELLAPVGDKERLEAAVYFGADAVYFAGKKFGLRALASNFDENEIKEAVEFCHEHNVKVYITVNILAHNADFIGMVDYLKYLDSVHVDGVIVSDLGIAHLVKEYTNLELHVSTQANISDSNRGACAQPCRWNYALYSKNEQNPIDEYFPVEEDARGTYILNSKDMCLIEHIKELSEAGIVSFKIEGRMKSTYYVATVVNAYRRAIDNYLDNKEPDFDYIKELQKTSNRSFTTGFYFNSNQKTNKDSSLLAQTYDYVAIVVEDAKDGFVQVEHRNKFIVGDELEVLSPSDCFCKKIKVEEVKDENGILLQEIKKVKQRVWIKTDLPLRKNDILRKKK